MVIITAIIILLLLSVEDMSENYYKLRLTISEAKEFLLFLKLRTAFSRTETPLELHLDVLSSNFVSVTFQL